MRFWEGREACGRKAKSERQLSSLDRKLSRPEGYQQCKDGTQGELDTVWEGKKSRRERLKQKRCGEKR